MLPPEGYHEFSGSRLADAIHWLKEHGETAFAEHESNIYFAKSILELEKKHFIPTFLRTNEPENGTLPPSTLELGIEIGGTKNRATIGQTDETALLTQLPGVEKAFTSKEFQDPDHFFSTVVGIGKPIIEQVKTLGETHAFHVIFSFSGTTHETSYGIDVTPDAHLSKGFIVPGIETVNVGESMWRHYKKQGLSVPRDSVMIVPNDGAAGLLNHPHAHIGLVDGTGIGGAIAIPDAHGIYWIYNTEIGELTSFPLSVPEQEVHTKGNVINRHLETIAGGESMGKVLNTIIRHMVQEGIIPYTIVENKSFSTKHISDIFANNRAQFKEIFQNFDEHDDVTWEILSIIAQNQRARSSQALGIANAALIHTYPDAFPNREILFPVEGSNFWKTQEFPDMITNVMSRYISNHSIKFVQSSGSLGATYGALRRYNQPLLSE
jgi:hexokinase